jgi:hypothetical protein
LGLCSYLPDAGLRTWLADDQSDLVGADCQLLAIGYSRFR